MPNNDTSPRVQRIEIGELPVECKAVANALSREPAQVTNYISDFQKVTVSGVCADGDSAAAIAEAASYVSGRIFKGTTCQLTRSPDYKYAGICEFTVTFNVLP